MVQHHPTVAVAHGDFRAEVDVDLADLILEMWRAGIETVDSCQDLGDALSELARHLPHLAQNVRRDSGRAVIGFENPIPLLALYDAVANAGPRDAFYERMVHWAAPGAWECITGIYDWGLVDGDGTFAPDGTASSRFAASSIQLRFPRTDIGEMTQRMRRHNRGEVVALGMPDWSSISLPDPGGPV